MAFVDIQAEAGQRLRDTIAARRHAENQRADELARRGIAEL